MKAYAIAFLFAANLALGQATDTLESLMSVNPQSRAECAA
jgi:hypothetical protein